MVCNVLIVIAFIGAMKVIIEKLWDNCLEGFFATLVSYIIPGLCLGILLGGVMIIGEFMCIFEDIYIFGYHPFLVGMVICSGLYIIAMLYRWIKSR